MLRDESDEALMQAYQGGEVRAFEVLLSRHRRGIYNFIRRHVGDTRADDLLQETFLRVVRAAGDYEHQAKFTTWLYTIARNLCVDALRRGAHRRTESLDGPAGPPGAGDGEGGGARRPRSETIGDPAPGTERQAMGKQLAERIDQAIAALPDEQREVFLMREREDLSFQEIAKIVGAPENTVKSRMRYALERLREALAEFEDVARAAQ